MPRGETAASPPTAPAGSPRVHYAVLCSRDDPCGPWLARGLAQRGLGGVRVVTAEELVYSRRVVHRQVRGRAETEITLPDGTVLGPDLRGVLNRVVHLPAEHLRASEPGEREYAVAETYALMTSVLASLPGVVNPAGPRGLCGPWLREAEWLVAAGRAGLGGVGFRTGRPPSERPAPDRSVVVAGERVVPADPGPPPPAAVASGCVELAAGVGAVLLGVHFVTAGEEWALSGATPLPDLRYGGEPLLDALVELVTAGLVPA